MSVSVVRQLKYILSANSRQCRSDAEPSGGPSVEKQLLHKYGSENSMLLASLTDHVKKVVNLKWSITPVAVTQGG